MSMRIAGLREAVLPDAPRLGPEDRFTFTCRPGVSCFNRCCGDVNIFLSPYDVLRMKRRLGISSGEFLDRHALLPVHKEMKLPVVLLRMADEEGRPCPFVGPEGCAIYEDRPWPCRMYPLGMAAGHDQGQPADEFYFLLKEEVCRGHEADRAWTVKQWLDDQDVGAWDEFGGAFKELTLHPFFQEGGVLPPEKLHMFYTACYDLDAFRKFVFETSLLQRFEVDEALVEEMRYDDEALLRFAFLWLRFALFGEETVRPRREVWEAMQEKMRTSGRPRPKVAAAGAKP